MKNQIKFTNINVFFYFLLNLKNLSQLEIDLNNNVAKINGVKTFTAANVMCTDLRAGAALILSALVSDGCTIVSRVYHVDRGYEDFEKKLNLLGVNIARINDDL